MSNAKIREVLESFRAVEWQRGDWQGFCVFRRALGCQGTDGHVSALGTPHPKPHSEHCPYAALNLLSDALEARE